MSLDIYAIVVKPVEVASHNITHNVHGQIRAAGADPWEYQGRRIADTLEELLACHKALHDPAREAELRKFDAPNGWGILDHSRKFVRALLRSAEDVVAEYPDATWRVSR